VDAGIRHFTFTADYSESCAQKVPNESALVILVPQAEALVKPFRDEHDPAEAAGVPSHVTLLYPFVSPDEIDAAVLAELRGCFLQFASFRYSLVAIRRFPAGVLYLALEPEEPFRRLTRAIWDRYPQTPPYGGSHCDIVPHLSVARLADERQLDHVADGFARAARGKLPIRATASEIVLMDTISGRWQLRATFALRS
jgi:hypothetical protein